MDQEKKVKAGSEELEQFVYYVAHDLQGPLLSISAFVSKIHGVETLTEEQQRWLNRILANVQAMQSLVHDLLQLSRLKRADWDFQEWDMNDIVKEVSAFLEPQFKEKNIDFKLDQKLPRVICQRERMMQVLNNLFQNSVSYLGGQSHPRINVGYMDKGAFFEFYVKDNGMGIDPKFHEKVFEIFQRMNPDSSEGTGLGLTICKKFIERHGGAIRLESALGEGTAFLFTLPKTWDKRESEYAAS